MEHILQMELDEFLHKNPVAVHPKTGKNYIWADDNIMDMNIEDLPPINMKQVDYLRQVSEKKIFSFLVQ